MEVRHLAQLLVLNVDDALREAARGPSRPFRRNCIRIRRGADVDEAASLRHTANRPVRPAGELRGHPAETAKAHRVLLDSPRSADPDVVEATERHTTMVEHRALLGWAQTASTGRLSDKLDLADALERATPRGSRPLHGDADDDDPFDQKGSAVAGVAAAALRFARPRQPDLAWATTSSSARRRRPRTGAARSSGSLLPYHPSFAAADTSPPSCRRAPGRTRRERRCCALRSPHRQISAAPAGAGLFLGCESRR